MEIQRQAVFVKYTGNYRELLSCSPTVLRPLGLISESTTVFNLRGLGMKQ